MKYSFILTSLVYGVVVFVWVILEAIKALYNNHPISEVSIPISSLLFTFVSVALVVHIIFGLIISISQDNNSDKDDNTPGTTNYQTM